MKTLVDIDDRLIRQAQKVSGAKTKKETIQLALQELLRRQKRSDLKQMIGSYQHGMSLKELLKLRSQS